MEKENNFNLISIEELLNKEIKEPRWIVKNLIPEAGIVVLSGDPGNGKTWLSLAIAQAVASGMPLFGEFEIQQLGAVLYIDEENGDYTLNPRMLKLGIQRGLPINFLIKEGVKLDKPEIIEKISGLITSNSIKLIIIDPLSQVYDGDENSAQSMAKVIGQIKTLTNLGVAVLLLHHHRKENINNFNSNVGSKLRGSSALFAAIDSHLAITKEEDVITIKQAKSRQAKEVDPFKVELLEKEGVIKFNYLGKIKKRDSLEEKSELLKSVLANGELSRQQIINVLHTSYGVETIDKVLRLNVEKGNVLFRRGKSGEHFYSLLG
jgi:RecA-family ATPase